MKTIYINKKGKLTKRKIRKIAKKVHKINKKEAAVIAICKELSQNEELLQELEGKGQIILDRKMAL
ncbi:MAG: hypothetical protein K2H53_06800 [Clostridia bacterium]|nr:hypothetical protein [Clostridia bacterium]